MLDPVGRFFATAPIDDIRRAQTYLDQMEPRERAASDALIEMCRGEHPMLKIVRIAANGDLVFERIACVQDEPKGQA